MPQPFEIKDGVLIRYNQCLGTLQSEITIPEGVTIIGKDAFTDCTNLQRITLPSTLREIDDGEVFGRCTGLTEITIPDGVTKIGEGAFYDCENLQKVTLPSTLNEIGEYVFTGCESLVEIIIPRNITKIENSAFSCCTKLQKVTLPSTLKEIGKFAFANCQSLTDVWIPKGVTEIAECGFYECESLKSISLPRTLKEIGENAFDGCVALTEIIFPVCPAEVDQDLFSRCPGSLRVIVEDDNEKEKFRDMDVFAGKDIVTISEKLLGDGYTQKQVIEINRLEYYDRLCFLGCNPENQNVFITFSKIEGCGAWEATNLDGNITRIEEVPSTDPCNTVFELMKKYESVSGTPMRNIAPIIMEPSLENEDGRPSNYILAAVNDLEAIQALEAAAEVAAIAEAAGRAAAAEAEAAEAEAPEAATTFLESWFDFLEEMTNKVLKTCEYQIGITTIGSVSAINSGASESSGRISSYNFQSLFSGDNKHNTVVANHQPKCSGSVPRGGIS